MKSTLILAALLAPFAAAHAHVTLEQSSAQAGAYQKLTFRVGHGCQGSPTRAITVMLPESVTGAKPMPKFGWTVTGAVREVKWSGGPLLDEHYDEFTMQVKLPADAGKVYFKVVQDCVKGSTAWDEMPGAADVKLKAPAPVLEILAAPGGHAHQH